MTVLWVVLIGAAMILAGAVIGWVDARAKWAAAEAERLKAEAERLRAEAALGSTSLTPEQLQLLQEESLAGANGFLAFLQVALGSPIANVLVVLGVALILIDTGHLNISADVGDAPAAVSTTTTAAN